MGNKTEKVLLMCGQMELQISRTSAGTRRYLRLSGANKGTAFLQGTGIPTLTGMVKKQKTGYFNNARYLYNSVYQKHIRKVGIILWKNRDMN